VPHQGVFLGVDDRDPLARIAREPQVLIATTAPWEGIAFQSRQACIVRLPCIGGTQETPRTNRSDPEAVVERMALLLAAVGVLLALGIGGAVARSLRTIMPTRGATGTPSVRLAASITAQSSAFRAGSSSGWAQA
jgi:hypothetical protein